MSFLEVEVSNKHNGPWLFPAKGGMLLRGRWDYLNVPHNALGEVHGVIQREIREEGHIPGMFIRIDHASRKITVHDPLRTTSAGQKLWNKIRGAVQTINGSPMDPLEDMNIDVDKDESGDVVLKSWLYWCAKGIETGQCVKTKESDNWPTSYEIDTTIPGGRTTSPYGSSIDGRTDYGVRNNSKKAKN